jgi:hypothetical protein
MRQEKTNRINIFLPNANIKKEGITSRMNFQNKTQVKESRNKPKEKQTLLYGR